MSEPNVNATCPTCGRTVVEVNLNDPEVGTCVFCDINAEGVDA